MFKIIDDPKVADELWVSRVLWWRYKSVDSGEWQLDETQSMDWCRPSRSWANCDHAIQVEE